MRVAHEKNDVVDLLFAIDPEAPACLVRQGLGITGALVRIEYVDLQMAEAATLFRPTVSELRPVRELTLVQDLGLVKAVLRVCVHVVDRASGIEGPLTGEGCHLAATPKPMAGYGIVS